MCGNLESRIHDTSGGTRDHKHTPMRVTCDTLSSICDYKHTPMRVTCDTLGNTRDHKHTLMRFTCDTLGSVRDHKHTPMMVTCDTLGSTRDHKHTPMRVTCSTHYCTFTVTSAIAVTLFLTNAKGFWLTLCIYTQIHTHAYCEKLANTKLMSKSPALFRS